MKSLSRTDIKNTLIVISKKAWLLFPDENTDIILKHDNREYITRLKVAPTGETTVLRRFRDKEISRWYRDNENRIYAGVLIKFTKVDDNRFELEINKEIGKN